MNSRFARLSSVTAFVTLAGLPLAARQAPAPAAEAVNLQQVLPFDAAVKIGTLPNGLKYYVRRNSRPANRVVLRLAVKTGSLDEADDQQGLAHMLEHMAFNGSEHFKPGELVSYFESTGARLGPHVNAQTGFEDTIYMLDLPTDKPEIVEKGLTAFADFAGGLTLDPTEIDKERGVVIEEWRGGLGAGSRIRDKQIPVLFYHSRYADRLPIGKPEVLRTFPPARLRAFYDTFYRPSNMAVVAVGDIDAAKLEEMVKDAFGGLKARGAAAPPARKVDVPLHEETLVSVVTDPEITQSSVSLIRKRPRSSDDKVGDYRRQLVRAVLRADAERSASTRSRAGPTRSSSAPASAADGLSKDVETVSLGANVQDGKIAEGLASVALEAKRAREFGFSAAELDRAKKWLAAFYERAYTERDKTESGSFAQEYLNHFLEGEPSPGIEYEYKLVQQLLPGITAAEVTAIGKGLLAGDSRVILATSPQKAGHQGPDRGRAEGDDRGGGLDGGHAVERHHVHARADRAQAGAGRRHGNAQGRRGRADHRPLRQRRRGLAEADRFQERPGALLACRRRGAPRSRRAVGLLRGVARVRLREPVGRRRAQGARHAEAAGRQAGRRVAVRVALDPRLQRLGGAGAARDRAAAALRAVHASRATIPRRSRC